MQSAAILASNTSALDIDAIAAVTARPQQVLGLHFFSPAHIMKLLEIVRGAKTDKAVLDAALELGRRIGKVAVLAGNQNAPNLRKRVDGVKLEASKHPGIQIVDTFFHAETPQDAAAEVVRVQNAYPDISGWAMVGGWPLFTRTLLGDLDPARVKIVAVDALPAQLPYVDKGLAPVLLAQPIYLWGKVAVETVIDKLHFKKSVPTYIPMELTRVTKSSLGAWATQLREWGFTNVDY
jgi:ribose transport system substrate-binding protein